MYIAGNGINFNENCTNHEEAETLIIHCLCLIDIHEKRVIVHAPDTDVFALMIAHLKVLSAKQIHQVWAYNHPAHIDISSVAISLGEEMSMGLLSLHCVPGCDTVGKYFGKSKRTWTKRFLQLASKDHKFLNDIIHFQEIINDELMQQLQKFMCYVYAPEFGINSLPECRYRPWRKTSAECKRFPPTKGAFVQHVKRAFRQLRIWKQAPNALIVEVPNDDNGWELEDGHWQPISTLDTLVPN